MDDNHLLHNTQSSTSTIKPCLTTHNSSNQSLNMKLLLILTLAGLAACEDYESVLQSPLALKNLFSEFNSQYNKLYSPQEAPLRMRLFRADLQRVVQLNKENDWVSGLNQFTAMTQAEKQQHLGLNISRAVLSEDLPELSAVPAASSIDWRSQKKVTGVKNQGGCGSCWAFAAVGAVETNYAIQTGKRKQFAEQEYLDCTYSSSRDGCKGGWYHEAWDYSKSSGRLATAAAAPYKEKDGSCSYSRVHNGLIGAVITGSKSIRKGEGNVISALNNGAVSVAYEVTDDFFKYTEGVIKDHSCKSYANHAVTAVGYTRGAMIVRNSWGAWGMKGYFYTARGHHGCKIFDYGSVPVWKNTGRRDNDPDYVDVDDNDGGDNTDGCPSGTVKCSDGVCRHAHMC